MAINKNDCALLFYAKTLGVNYSETLTLGRLSLFASQGDVENIIRRYNNNEKSITAVNFVDEYSEPVFELLGAQKIESMDFSAYEKATIIHDLNLPIPSEVNNRFSVVVDGGTVEHVFNFPVAIKNCMQAVKVGGHYIGISPGNNQMGHGFYQFSPELYFRVFSEANGFRVKKMLINVSVGDTTAWYEVGDPKTVNSRVALTNNLPVTLMVVAEKMAEKTIFETTPQQIDYVNTWDAHQSIVDNKMVGNESKLKFLYRKLVPKRLKIIIRNIYDIFVVEKTKDTFIGEFNPKHFRKVDI
jgi:hypothetical protein